MKYVGYVIGFLGFFIMLGTAGADCDGKCMENSLTMMEIIEYTILGMSMMVMGIYLGVKYD
jgi:hypothetical protein|tara:strand:+ start:783 stop:965 length:183 start_codon:yes stop_codon:yes gene_type:complete